MIHIVRRCRQPKAGPPNAPRKSHLIVTFRPCRTLAFVPHAYQRNKRIEHLAVPPNDDLDHRVLDSRAAAARCSTQHAADPGRSHVRAVYASKGVDLVRHDFGEGRPELHPDCDEVRLD